MNISIFRDMTSKTPLTGTLEEVVNSIKTDEKLAIFTASYRQTGSKTFKHDAPLFAVACIFEGGKGMDNILRHTQLSLVDFDHCISEERKEESVESTSEQRLSELEKLKQKICADPHTLLCYITMSGNGLRVIFSYEGDDYLAAFTKGNAYYEQLAGMEADSKCKNITRLSGLAHDPAVYYNPDAQPFTAEEILSFQASIRQKSQKQKKQERIEAYYKSIIQPKLESDGIRYEPGHHNEYVMRVGYMLAKKRYAKADAITWALKQFPEYDGVKQVLKSCYANTQQPRKGQGNDGGEGKDNRRFASVDEIKDFLDGHIQLRYNIITARYEYLNKKHSSSSTPHPKWENLQDRHVNTLWSTLSSTTRVNKGDMLNVIESDYTPSFHPFKDYLENLPPWQEGAPDYITELASTVKVKGESDSSLFTFSFSLKKWLVAMIAGWIDNDAVNNVILVLIGRQGAYKTTWFNYLLPPELKQYFYTKTNAKRMTKDDLIALSQYALVCCEELDTMTPSELNQLKAAVTMPCINERAAYAHYAEQRKHINTFCGTGNNPEFLSDPTGNRRWIPYEVESILSPREHPFNHAGIYAQAYALYNSGFRYWFSDEEIELQNQHNRQFEAPRLEQELVDLYFRKPTEEEGGEFVSVARALQLISCNIGQKLSAMKIGKAFSDLGFQKVRTNRSRGFIAIIRTAEDIRAYQISQRINAEATDEE